MWAEVVLVFCLGVSSGLGIAWLVTCDCECDCHPQVEAEFQRELDELLDAYE